MKLSSQLAVFLRDNNTWYPKPVLLEMVWKDQKKFTKYTAETVGRKLRGLENGEESDDGLSVIACKPYGKTVQYKWMPKELRSKYIPVSDRLDDKLFRK
jgi:hypothetical protein